MDEIHVDELTALLEDDAEVEVVDIRSAAAFEHAHIPDSRNLPLPELVDRIEELDSDADRIVTVCPHGKSSLQAARLITSYDGIEETPVQSLAEGLEGWDGPLESDTDAESAPF